ncbi:membrane-bound alkaline phosphatase-like [Schistocerca serialis cubense]|uniref:membrane-bound alkaline phosphatase-like n=1 Tax=Schistocerca serialis cubense TaxID=2023355 RepID=UPI00214E4615|nr:membrane-bound alkaline phosphatase-like [Schistocerca serialis cubense]
MHQFTPRRTGLRTYASTVSTSVESRAPYWTLRAQQRLVKSLFASQVRQPAKNVIMFLGDGMSIATLTAARMLLGQRQGLSGEEAQLSFEEFPNAGLSKTYCVDAQVGDSACTSTAYLCGVKANTGTMGVTAALTRGDCDAQNNTANHVDSIIKWAQDAGKATGIVTTVTVTHASPGGGYAHIADRNWESDADVIAAGGDPAICPDIADQLVNGNPGRNIKVILGGGRKMFLPNTTVDEEGASGRRWDSRNLISEWLDDKSDRDATASYVWNRDQLLAVDTEKTDYLLGLFESSYMQYHLDADNATEPRLKELTEVAIKMLEKNRDGYFLFVEGGKIDVAHHSTLAHKALDEAIELSEAVRVAHELTDERDTLIVVTADHAHTMSLSGYAARGNDIFGFAGSDSESMPYQTLGYANGPQPYLQTTEDGSRRNLAEVETGDKEYEFPSMVPLFVETHGGDDVAVLSRGPWSHLLTGVFEQNYIPHVMAYAACVGNGLTACHR